MRIFLVECVIIDVNFMGSLLSVHCHVALLNLSLITKYRLSSLMSWMKSVWVACLCSNFDYSFLVQLSLKYV